MPKIIFWNIQRAGGDILSEVTDDLRDDLEALGSNHNPDIIILCEGVGDLQDNMVGNNCIPTSYSIEMVDSTYGDYTRTTTLRYIVMRRNNIQCSCYLIDGNHSSRPALLICLGNECFLAMHAPSVTSTTKPQTEQMRFAHDRVRKLIRNNRLPLQHAPRMIFGDLNVNIRDQRKINSFRHHIQGSKISTFHMVDPGVGTHRNKNTRKYDTTLDWAYAEPGFNPVITVVEETKKVDTKKRKPVNNYTRTKKKSKPNKFVQYKPQDFIDDDDDFTVTFENLKYPDHKPIMLEW